jgi:hypothetical protein
MQQALMALEEGMTSKEWRELVKALRERLAQPEQELVAAFVKKDQRTSIGALLRD